jgi:hypothetical protein
MSHFFRVNPFFVLFTLSFLSCFFFINCQSDVEYSRKAPDVSDMKVDVQIQRFDKDLFAVDTNQMEQSLEALRAKYPDFLTLFASEIINNQYDQTETPIAALSSFLRAPELRNLYDSVQLQYAHLAQTEKDLSQLFKYYKYYFPEKPTPKVVSIISEFGTDAFVYSDSGVGIGLDLFLGKQFSGYIPDLFPEYIKRSFEQEFIPVKMAKVLSRDMAGTASGQRLLDLMLYNGKVLYTTGLLLPHTPDSLIMDYSAETMEGCYFNEKSVWKRILDEKLLYSTDRGDIRKLVEPSPNAPKVFDEAPGEIGNWIGWRIVQAYMTKHPNTSLKELYALTDSQKFLEQANYRPKR